MFTSQLKVATQLCAAICAIEEHYADISSGYVQEVGSEAMADNT